MLNLMRQGSNKSYNEINFIHENNPILSLEKMMQLIKSIYYVGGFCHGYEKGAQDLATEYINNFDENTTSSSLESIVFKWEDILRYIQVQYETEWGEKLLEKLFKIYIITNWKQVAKFIKEHPYLDTFLFEAAEKFISTFGTDIILKLKKVVDPEFPEETKLMAYIYTDLPFEEAIEKIKYLHKEWFINNSDNVRRRFNFNVK